MPLGIRAFSSRCLYKSLQLRYVTSSHSCTLKMEAIRSSETSVLIRATRCHLPEDDNHQYVHKVEHFSSGYSGLRVETHVGLHVDRYCWSTLNKIRILLYSVTCQPIVGLRNRGYAAQRILCCWFSEACETMGQVPQCTGRLCWEIKAFSKFVLLFV
jgi:hypothetical protein